MIIYIHGYGSRGLGSKAKKFRDYCQENNIAFIAPSLSYIPDLAIQTLEELIESYNGDVTLIGSSMGGYMSIYLATKYDLKAVLINPTIFPYKTLRQTLGYTPSFYDGSKFEWNEKHLEMLQKYEVNEVQKENFMLLLQKGDSLLNFQEAVDKFIGATIFVEDGGTHSFEGIERYFEKIVEYLRGNEE
ncbi:MAG: YqiA/YcfP family alpha/beta fold hydrolase [Sulfurimonas sp.]